MSGQVRGATAPDPAATATEEFAPCNSTFPLLSCLISSRVKLCLSGFCLGDCECGLSLQESLGKEVAGLSISQDRPVQSLMEVGKLL